MPRTATIRYDAPASAEAAVRTMDGTRLRSHTLKVRRRRMPCTRAWLGADEPVDMLLEYTPGDVGGTSSEERRQAVLTPENSTTHLP